MGLWSWLRGERWDRGYMPHISRILAVDWQEENPAPIQRHLGGYRDKPAAIPEPRPRRSLVGLTFGARRTVMPDDGPMWSTDFIHALRLDGGALKERWRVDVCAEGVHHEAQARFDDWLIFGRKDGGVGALRFDDGVSRTLLPHASSLAKPPKLQGEKLRCELLDGSVHLVEPPFSSAAIERRPRLGRARSSHGALGAWQRRWQWRLGERELLWLDAETPRGDLRRAALAIIDDAEEPRVVELGLGRRVEPGGVHVVDGLFVATSDFGRDSDLDPTDGTVLVDLVTGTRLGLLQGGGRDSLVRNGAGNIAWKGEL